jgi:hypothetical protein
MDFVNKFTGGSGEQKTTEGQQGSSSGEQQQGGGGFLGGLGNKVNEAAGGGQASEKNEDYLDKGTYQAPLQLPSYPSFHPVVILTLPRYRHGPGEVHGCGRPVERGIYLYCDFVVHGLTVLQSAVEQAKDEQISDFIRGQYKNTTGSDLPIKDKPTTFN